MQGKFVIREYVKRNGRSPFREWLDSLDKLIRARVQGRVARFETGNLGDFKQLGAGIFEARLDVGPGYRIYVARDGQVIILLLCGGDKSTQTRDIERAKVYWKEYQEGSDAKEK